MHLTRFLPLKALLLTFGSVNYLYTFHSIKLQVYYASENKTFRDCTDECPKQSCGISTEAIYLRITM